MAFTPKSKEDFEALEKFMKSQTQAPTHGRAIEISPTYARLLGNKIVSREASVPADQAKPLRTKGGEVRDINFPERFPQKQENFVYPQPTKTVGGNYSGRKEHVSSLLEASKQRYESDPESFHFTPQQIRQMEEARQRGKEMEAEYARMEAEERHSEEMNRFRRGAEVYTRQRMASAKKMGRTISDEDLQGYDVRNLGRDFEHPTLQKRQEDIRAGNKTTSLEGFLPTQLVEQLRKQNEEIQKDIDAQKQLTDEKIKQRDDLKKQRQEEREQRNLDKEMSKWESEENKNKKTRYRGVIGKFHDFLDKTLGPNETHRGQMGRQVASQLGRTFFPRAYSRISQVYDLMKMFSGTEEVSEDANNPYTTNKRSIDIKDFLNKPPANSGSPPSLPPGRGRFGPPPIPPRGGGWRFPGGFGGGGGGRPPIPIPGPTGAGGAAGRGLVAAGRGLSAAGRGLVAGLIAFGSNPVGAAIIIGAAVATAGALIGLKKHSDELSKAFEKLKDIGIHTRIAEIQNELMRDANRLRVGSERAPNGESLDTLTAKGLGRRGERERAWERFGMVSGRFWMNNTSWIDEIWTKLSVGMADLGANIFRKVEFIQRGFWDLLMLDVKKAAEDFKKAWNNQWFGDPGWNDDFWYKASELNSFFYGANGFQPGLGQNKKPAPPPNVPINPMPGVGHGFF